MTKALRTIDLNPVENLTSAFDMLFPKKEKIEKAFDQFIIHNEDPHQLNCVRFDIAESWLRSRNFGVSQKINLLNRKVMPSKLNKVFKENQLLIEVVKSILLEDLSFLKYQSDFFVYLYDRNCIYLLSFKGNEDFNYNQRIGVDGSEQSIGTTSHSLSILLDKPILLIPSENFNKTIQHASAAISVPIHNTKKDIIGALTFVYPEENDLYIANRGMLSGMISLQISLVKKIENILKINTQKQALFNTFSSLTDEGLIVINKEGKIQNINSKSEKLLGASSDHYKDKSISEVIGGFNYFNEKKLQKDFSTQLLSCNEKRDCVVRVVPIENEDGAIIRLTSLTSQNDQAIKNHSKNLNALYTFSDILGDSPELSKTKQLAAKFATTPRNILLLGESGTGKELFAHAIHNASRSEGPFVTINCASLPRGLVESEFFGYEAGSFTGAARKGRAGKLEIANGGTLFLDEIGDMPLGFQPILLRVLEDKRIMRIGGEHYLPTNFRVIAATNKDLIELIAQNLFRKDLFYRLSHLKITIPALKKRREDIPLLARHFINKQCQEYNLTIPSIDPAVDKALMSYEWPGNIREFQNVICTALSLAENGVIKVTDLPPEILTEFPDLNNFYELKTLDEVEEQVIQDAMISTGYNVKKAATALGISRTTLYQKLKKYNINTHDEKL